MPFHIGLSGFPPNINICVSAWSTFQDPGPPGTPYPSVIDGARFGRVQGTICSILASLTLSLSCGS